MFPAIPNVTQCLKTPPVCLWIFTGMQSISGAAYSEHLLIQTDAAKLDALLVSLDSTST